MENYVEMRIWKAKENTVMKDNENVRIKEQRKDTGNGRTENRERKEGSTEHHMNTRTQRSLTGGVEAVDELGAGHEDPGVGRRVVPARPAVEGPRAVGACEGEWKESEL